MEKKVVKDKVKKPKLKDKLKELAIRLAFENLKPKELEKPLEKIVKIDTEKPDKTVEPDFLQEEKSKEQYIDNIPYEPEPEKKETYRLREGMSNMDMVIEIAYRDYFKIFYSLYWVEYEVSRQLNIWRQSNRVMARCYGLKT